MWTKIKQGLLNVFFPFHCVGCEKENTLLCASCMHSIPIYTSHSRKPGSLDNILVAASYHDPIINKAIKTAKYWPFTAKLIQSLSTVVIQFLHQFPQICMYLSKNNFILIPVPLCKRKYAQRGFNQAERLAAAISHEFKWPVNTNILAKIKRTQSQTKLPYKKRKTNIKNAFSVLETRFPKNIILVDDVLTTGATLEEAAKTLKRAGAENIWAIVLAKS